METTATAPTCPGCHFACSLDAYRCGRGQGFSRMWREGKEVPERRVRLMPQLHEGESANSMPPEPNRIMRAISILGRKAEACNDAQPEQKVLMAIARQGGFFALDKLAERASIDEAILPTAVSFLINAGFAAEDQEEVAGVVLRITPEGREQQRIVASQRDERIKEFLAPLSDEELATLNQLALKLIG